MEERRVVATVFSSNCLGQDSAGQLTWSLSTKFFTAAVSPLLQQRSNISVHTVPCSLLAHTGQHPCPLCTQQASTKDPVYCTHLCRCRRAGQHQQPLYWITFGKRRCWIGLPLHWRSRNWPCLWSLPQSVCSFSGPDSGRGHYWHLVSLGHKKGGQETTYQLHIGSVHLHQDGQGIHRVSQEAGGPAHVMT